MLPAADVMMLMLLAVFIVTVVSIAGDYYNDDAVDVVD